MSIDYTKKPARAETAIPFDFPRRARLDQQIPEERMIGQALDEVENLGAHPMLTDVVVKLGEAKDKLSDWHDAGRPGESR